MVSCQLRNAALALRADFTLFVMPGLEPGIHVFSARCKSRTWMAGTFGAKTRFALLPGHDELDKVRNHGE
jgi:hypothetical protein